ncbi:caspase domain-containing protein [Mycena sp. CBHHK59/15]|nr:caspase domain-containing protein [Mycena sp. CBHHK59/15]
MARRYFGLFIGIDEYGSPAIPNLEGCVSDARSFQECLSRTFGPAPQSDILFLTNTDATRAAILSAFYTHLIDNPEIERGEPIVIYFAGHGSRVLAPTGWDTPSGQVETICPSNESTQAEGELIHGIPDFTINALLRILAREKGNNVTLVCDSCHSGGVTRHIREEKQTARYHPAGAVRMPADIDVDILKRANGEGLEFGFHGSRSSHVLLAACAADESAYEGWDTGRVRGAFTTALKRHFEILESQIRIGTVTYCDLVRPLKLRFQHPQCDGQLRNGFLFAERNKVAPYLFKLASKKGTLCVAAGAVHGIVEGTEVLVYKKASALIALGVLVACEVGAVTATLRRKDPADFVPVPDKLGWARILRWNTGDLKVYTDPLLSLQLPEPSSEYPVRQVDVKSTGHIALHASGPTGTLTIERMDRLITTYAVRNIPIPHDSMNPLPFILNRIAHFQFHLGRQKPPATTLLQVPMISRHVAVKMYLLNRRHEDGTVVPDENNIFRKNVARLSISKASWNLYGIKIVNKSSYSLYPYLFFFDPSDYSIEALYLPSFTAVTPPLGPKGFLTVGYGGDGGAPLRFKPQEGVSDASFLKLIVSTKNINLDHISQSSPFETPSALWPTVPLNDIARMPVAVWSTDHIFWDVSLAVIAVTASTTFTSPLLWQRISSLFDAKCK